MQRGWGGEEQWQGKETCANQREDDCAAHRHTHDETAARAGCSLSAPNGSARKSLRDDKLSRIADAAQTRAPCTTTHCQLRTT